MKPVTTDIQVGGLGLRRGYRGALASVEDGRHRRRGRVPWLSQSDTEEHWAGRLFAARRSARLAA